MAPRALRHKQRKYYFYRKKARKSADFLAFAFHGRGLDGKRQRGGKQASPLRQFVALTATSPKGRGLGMAAKSSVSPEAPSLRELAHEVRLKE